MLLCGRIFTEFQFMRVSQFVESMREYGCEKDSLYVDGIWGNRDRGQVWELIGTDVAGCLAKSISVKFYGGPPGYKKIYRGSLLTLLIDRVMMAALADGMLAAKPLFPQEYANEN
jgi:hypothetical protein